MQNLLTGMLAILLASILHAPAWAQKQEKKALPPVKTTTVTRQQLTDVIEALGTLRANESVTLTTNVTETITAIHFTDGQRVNKETVLAEMTSSEEQAQLNETRADLQEAQRQYRRFQELVSKGAASASLLDQRKRNYETAKARLSAVQSRLGDRLITAPFDGIIGLRKISVGSLVEPGDPIATLDDDRMMKLDFTVPSVHLSALSIGTAVTATSPAFHGKAFNGKISAIDSRIDPVTRAITVRAELPNPDALLKPGLLMQVNIDSNLREALVVPESSVILRGNQHFLIRVDHGQTPPVAVQKKVTIGTRQNGIVEILNGVEEGTIVITDGMRARPGQAVKVME